MAFDGTGVYSAPASSFNPAVSGTEISHTDWNTLLADFATAFTKAICKDGQSTTTAVITFAVGVKINNTGLQVFDTDASHYLSIVPGSNLTAARTFTLTTGDAARTLDMSAGSLTAGGGQYVFPASQNASSNANTLDDYEEGTFTPAMSFGGGTTGITYTSQYGSYTKVGNRCIFLAAIVLSNNGSSTGNALVTGLPFTAADETDIAAGIRTSTIGSSIVCPQVHVVNTGTTIGLFKLSSGTASAMQETDVPDTANINISGAYRTA